MQDSRNAFLTKPLNICLLAAVSCALWGSAAPMIKTGYELFSISESQTATMLLFAGLRFALAGVMVILFESLTSRRLRLPKAGSWGNVFKLSLFQTVGQYILFYVGVANSSGVHTSILTGASNLWAILLACYLFREERMTLPKMLVCVLGFGGILMMNLSGGGSVSFLGEGFVLFSGICSGVSSSLAKRYSQKENSMVLTGWQFLAGGLFMCLIGLICGGRMTIPSAQAAGVLVYLGFLSATAYSLWAIMLQYNPVSSVVIYGFMTPMFGVVFSVGWTPCVGAFLGSALALASQQAHMVEGLLMLLAYSLGLGIPFVISAVLIEYLKSAFNWIKKNYKVINAVSGGLLVLLGVLMATGLFGRLLAGLG